MPATVINEAVFSQDFVNALGGSYQEAVNIFNQSPALVQMLNDAFTLNGSQSVLVRTGEGTFAFPGGIVIDRYDLPPLLNTEGLVHIADTLAHELGHVTSPGGLSGSPLNHGSLNDYLAGKTLAEGNAVLAQTKVLPELNKSLGTKFTSSSGAVEAVQEAIISITRMTNL